MCGYGGCICPKWAVVSCLSEEKQTALNSLGLSNWIIKDYEIGTEQVERCLIKENKLSACQQFKTFYTNCSSYNETSNECLVMNKLYYTESEMTNILNEWENERINLIANTKISRDNKVKQEIKKFVDVQNDARKDWIVGTFYIDPLSKIPSSEREIWNAWLNQGLHPAALLAPPLMAIILLILACLNFMNTALATSSSRLKEIGIAGRTFIKETYSADKMVDKVVELYQQLSSTSQ